MARNGDSASDDAQEKSWSQDERVWADSPDDWPAEPSEVPSRSTLKRVVLALFLIGGLVLIGCCGGMGFVLHRIRSGFSTDPVAVRQTTDEIVPIQIPPDFEPVGKLEVDLPLIPYTKVVFYAWPDEKGLLVLADLGIPMEQATRDVLRRTSERLRDRATRNEPARRLVVKERRWRRVRVGEKELEFEFAQAEDPETHVEYRQVTGFVPGHHGAALVLFVVEEHAYNEATVLKILESAGGGERADQAADL